MILYQQYLPILLLLLVSIAFACSPLICNGLINFIINRKNPNKKIIELSKNNQLSAYECGFEPFSDARFMADDLWLGMLCCRNDACWCI